jgi:rhodanese-related sulfurtransferase
MGPARAMSRHARILENADKTAAPGREPRTSIPVHAWLLAIALTMSGCATAPDPEGAAPSSGGTGTPAYVQTLPAEQVETWLGLHYDGLVLDIRQPGEWEDDLGHLDQAVLIPMPELEVRLEEIERYRSKSVLIYDRSGALSQRAGQVLVNSGFRDVSVLAGGLEAYRRIQPR